MKAVIPIAFAGMILLAIASIFGELVMRIYISRRAARGQKLRWWAEGGDTVSGTYQRHLPESWLPRIRRAMFLAFLACCVALLTVIFLNHR